MIKNKGFTLIELLVVFAVIGLLAGVILASVKSVRERANINKTLQYGKSVDNLLAADAVGIWNFDDQTNPTKDTSGWANHGTINGAAFTDDTPHKAAGAGAGKYALSFDGTDDYVDCGNAASLNITGAITVEAWVKLNEPPSDYPRIIDKLKKVDASHWYGYDIILIKNNKKIVFEIGFDDSSFSNIASASTIVYGQWHHIVATYDREKLRMYINGQQDASPVSATKAIGIYNYNFKISNLINGLIDEVRIFSRALTQTEIRKLYAEGATGHGIVLK